MTQELENDELYELRQEQLRMDGYEEFADEYDEETQELVRSYVDESRYIAFF